MLAHPSAPSLSGCMTFGVELEFIVVCPIDYFKPEDAVAAISRALIAKGVDSTGHEWYDEDAEIFSDKSDYSQWIVQGEGGLFLSEQEEATLNQSGFEIYCVEISSRKLEFAQNWQPELVAVLGVLDDVKQRGCSFITNATTGFHMHVGFGNDIVPLRTAKNVLQFCTAFEDRLDALYPTNRIDEDCAERFKLGEHFNAGLPWHFQNNKATDFGPNVFHWLVSIKEASSYDQLGRFFKNTLPFDTEVVTNGHYSTVNIDNLYSEFDDKPKGTIEFRQQASTLDFAEICAHIELIRTIVTWCHLVSDIEFRGGHNNILDPDNMTLGYFR